MGMSWNMIMQYADMISYISKKYSGDHDLAEDVTHEVMIKLFEDKKLDIRKFDPAKKDAAIRNTIRNKILKVLRSRKIGRWSVDSIDELLAKGYQIDTTGSMMRDPCFIKHPILDTPNDEMQRDGG